MSPFPRVSSGQHITTHFSSALLCKDIQSPVSNLEANSKHHYFIGKYFNMYSKNKSAFCFSPKP